MMRIFNINISTSKPLTNYDIWRYACELGILNLRTVCMLDNLPTKPNKTDECGVVNFNKTGEKGSHWVAYYWKKGQGQQRIYFDSFGQITPIEIQKYLKTREEFEQNKNVIQRNTDIVQPINSSICGHLCLFVLKVGSILKLKIETAAKFSLYTPLPSTYLVELGNFSFKFLTGQVLHFSY